ncbi:hypothetical protein HaLaN_04290, partial [Haematococcus lacustris]
MQRLSKAHSVTATSIKRLPLPHFGLLLGAGQGRRRVLVGLTLSFRTGVTEAIQSPKCTRWEGGLAIRHQLPRALPEPSAF